MYEPQRSAEKSVREASARALYLSVLEAGYRYPEFLTPKLAAIKKDQLKYARYKAYVAHLLYAHDELLAVVDDPEWHATFVLEVSDHLDYLCADWPIANVAQFFFKTRKKLQEMIVSDKREACRSRQDWKELVPPSYQPKS